MSKAGHETRNTGGRAGDAGMMRVGGVITLNVRRWSCVWRASSIRGLACILLVVIRPSLAGASPAQHVLGPSRL